MKMWSGRFRQPLDPAFEQWQRSFPYDQRLLPFELAASRAHANALEHAGVLSGEEISEVVEGLNQIGRLAESSPELSDCCGSIATIRTMFCFIPDLWRLRL